MPSNTLSVFGGTLQPNPSRELTQTWYESSPWGDSDQHAAYIPSRASASAVLPYIFAGTHFTYPQRDERLSQLVECRTPEPSHASHYGAIPSGQSPIHVLTRLMIGLTSVIKHKMFSPCYVSPHIRGFQCSAYKYQCRNCHKFGHFSSLCYKKQ